MEDQDRIPGKSSAAKRNRDYGILGIGVIIRNTVGDIMVWFSV